MQQLLGLDAAGADGTLLRELFLQRLPANVRMVLASSGETSTLEELAQLGDKIIAAASPAVASVTKSLSSKIDELRAEVSRLRETVSALTSPQQHTRHRSPYRQFRQHSPSSRHQSRLRSPSPHPRMCWYHTCFGDRAQKYSPPCCYSGNGKAST